MRSYCTIFISIAVSTFIACSSDESENSNNSFDIEIPFKAEASGVELSCDSSIDALGVSESKIAVKDFRFYVHNVNVIDKDGSSFPVRLETNNWQLEEVALLDFQNKQESCSGEEKQTNKSLKGQVSVDPSLIQSIEFSLGVPSNLNHRNPASALSPMNVPSMFWAWQTGYKFMRIDVAPESGITRPSDDSYQQSVFNFHLGSTGCEGNPELSEEVVCTRENRPKVVLSDFKPDGQTYISVDYAKLVADLSLASDEGGAPGCMSNPMDPECQSMFGQLGIDLSSGKANAASQVVFSVKSLKK